MKKAFFGIAVILTAASLLSCSKQPSPAASTPSATRESVPSATPTAEPFALLIAPETPATGAAALAVQAVEDFAAEKGWRLRRAAPGEDALAADRLGSPGLVASVGSGLGPAVFSAAQAHPDVRFVAVEEAGTQPLPNLMVVGGENFRRDQAAFLTGLLATIENGNDYVGWIGEAGTVRGKIYQNGFRHGVRYMCPRCRVFDFELDPSADAAAGTSSASQLLENYIDTASAIPGAAGEAGLALLAKNGVRVAGAETDFYPALFENGAAAGAKNVLGGIAFRPDLLLADLLPRFAGGEAFAEPVAYSLENGGLEYAPFPNDWVSSARQEYLRNILAEVASGRLDIGIDPQSGDER
jgi:basic membrane lipoprotein Med (substrate-binding protein (PBP1-ABC) superfamily)